jgi:uncharacterized protein YecT (DUF1311 family)
MLSLLISLSITLLSVTLLERDIKAEEELPYAYYYDHYKKEAIERARESGEALQERFTGLLKLLKENPPTGEEEHDGYIQGSLKQNQSDWLAYRYSYCQSRALIEVYPSNSRLYTETVNACLARLNKERISYLDELILEFKK